MIETLRSRCAGIFFIHTTGSSERLLDEHLNQWTQFQTEGECIGVPKCDSCVLTPKHITRKRRLQWSRVANNPPSSLIQQSCQGILNAISGNINSQHHDYSTLYIIDDCCACVVVTIYRSTSTCLPPLSSFNQVTFPCSGQPGKSSGWVYIRN